MSSRAGLRLRKRSPRQWVGLVSLLSMATLTATSLAPVQTAVAHPGHSGGSGGGPVVLDGMDPVCHSGGEDTDGYIEAVLESMWDGSTRPNDGSIAVIGHAASAGAGGCGGSLSSAMTEFVGGITPTPAVSYAGTTTEIDSFFAALEAAEVQPAILWIPDNWSRSGGVEDTITAHATDIADFVNSGGALFSNYNSYGWLTALLPAAVFNDDGCNGGPEVTDAGFEAFPTLTDQLVTACWHGYFTGDTGSLVPLVDYPFPEPTSPRVAVAIGGGSVTLPSVFTLQLPVGAQPVGSPATFTATVNNSELVPQAGVTVTFTITSGPHAGFTATAVTDAEGRASVTLTGTAPGTDTVTATVVANGATETAEGTVEWVGVAVPEPEIAPAIGLDLELQMQPGQAVAGAPVDVVGYGLMPFSTVRIELHSEPVLLGTAVTDSAGSFSTRVFLPSTIVPGEHEVVAIGISPLGAPVTDQAEIFVDWSGALAAPIATAGYTAISPVRVLDTRESLELAAGATYRLAVANVAPDDVTALALNVTITEAAKAGFLTVHPCDSLRPWASAINYVAGETVSNLVVPAFQVGDEVCFYTTAATHLVVDLNGYHQTSSSEKLLGATPTRLADTRSTATLAAGETLEVDVIGDGRAANASSAVSLHVTVDGPGRAGFLTVYPCGAERPWAANVNYAAGQTVGNDVLAKVGASGRVCIYTMSATDVVVDLNGWFVNSADGASLRPLVPGRFIDTRESVAVQAGQTVQLVLVGDDAFPVGTTAVAMNVAVDDAAGSGFLTIHPCGADRPWASNLNFVQGQTVSSHVTAQVGDGGTVCIYSSATTDVVVDIDGSFSTTD